MMPALPKSMMTERDSTKGGETTGSTDTTLKRPPSSLVLSCTYSST